MRQALIKIPLLTDCSSAGGFCIIWWVPCPGGVLAHAPAQDSLLTLIRKRPFWAPPPLLTDTISLWKYSAEVKGIYKSNQINV